MHSHLVDLVYAEELTSLLIQIGYLNVASHTKKKKPTTNTEGSTQKIIQGKLTVYGQHVRHPVDSRGQFRKNVSICQQNIPFNQLGRITCGGPISQMGSTRHSSW